MKIGFGYKDIDKEGKDPLLKLKFYNKSKKDRQILNDNEIHHRDMFRPNGLQEISIRFYYRNDKLFKN